VRLAPRLQSTTLIYLFSLDPLRYYHRQIHRAASHEHRSRGEEADNQQRHRCRSPMSGAAASVSAGGDPSQNQNSKDKGKVQPSGRKFAGRIMVNPVSCYTAKRPLLTLCLGRRRRNKRRRPLLLALRVTSPAAPALLALPRAQGMSAPPRTVSSLFCYLSLPGQHIWDRYWCRLLGLRKEWSYL
jgi:hypothetical protein